jgi:putative ABC transport system permease protein
MRLFTEPKLIYWLVGLTLFTGLLSGLYPAFYLSAFKPITVLKGKLVNNYSATIIRKGLVVLQFSISIGLIIGVIVIWKQLQFVRNEQLGFEKEQQIVLPLRSADAVKNYEALKGELLKDPDVRIVSCGSSYPGISNINDMLFYAEGKTKDEFVDVTLATVDYDYPETLGFNLLYGRTFSKDPHADSTSMIVNETALRKLGYDPRTAVGRTINYDWENAHHTVQIIGVVKDFHSESLHNEIKPFGFATNFLGEKHGYLIARLKTASYSGLVARVEKTWNAVNPGTPFEYSFLDQDFQKNYEREERTSQIVSYFTLIAILVACLGLFGLAAFSAEQRVKEIGIRKVLGASVFNLAKLLSGDFIKLVLLAMVIASPLAWYGMTKWLQDFAYKIRIEWWMFSAAGILAVLIALMTVSFQAVKAALANPVKSLRSE